MSGTVRFPEDVCEWVTRPTEEPSEGFCDATIDSPRGKVWCGRKAGHADVYDTDMHAGDNDGEHPVSMWRD